MDVFTKHRIKIASDTMKLSCEGCRIMGGPDHVAAFYTLQAYGIRAIDKVAPDCTCKIGGVKLLTEELGIKKEGN